MREQAHLEPGGNPMKVQPYHSGNPTDPDVHHDHDNCPSGQQIPLSNKIVGTGGYPRCQHCVGLG